MWTELGGTGGPWWSDPVALRRRRVEQGLVAVFPVARGRQLHGVDGVLCRHRRLICAMVVNFDGSGAPLISEAPGGT
jgi:hypothetical protein